MIISKPLLLSLPIFFISTAAISIAINLNFSNVTATWTILSSWRRTPYLYVIINVIIIIIAVISRFGHQKADHDSEFGQTRSIRTPPPSHIVAAASPVPEMMNFIGVAAEEVYEAERSESELGIVDLKPVVVNGVTVTEAVENESGEAQAPEDDDLAVPTSADDVSVKINSVGASSDFLLPIAEKPLLLSRFGHRKPVKASSEGGRALKVAKPKRQETLETTWKMITEGRHVPLTRHLKKADAFDHHPRRPSINKSDIDCTPREVDQHVDESETLLTPEWSPRPRRMKKDPSLSQDELNRRVEAFIKKFNEEMRLQRLESLNRYTEMINRGAS